MSQHSQRTQRGPSVASIITGGILVLAAVAVSTWIVNSPWLTWREVAGSVGWSLLAVLLTGQVVGRVMERRVIADRIERDRRRADRAAQRVQEERALNTGTWQGDAVGQVLSVRYDPADGSFYAEGWLGDHFQIHPERLWTDRATLVQTLAELELTGELEPMDDEGTRAVRARLDLPDWDRELGSVTQPAGEPREDWMDTDDPRTEVLTAIRDELGVEDTRRLPRPHIGPFPDQPGTYFHQGGPSAAALRPIAVPVFRTEAERAAWASERDMPTELFPVQPDA